jgi:hypothetical protein
VKGHRAALAAACAAALALTGCASIPSETNPQVVEAADSPRGDGDMEAGPAEDSSDEGILRGFVDANANPADDYAASRRYIDPEAREQWQPTRSVVVLTDSYDVARADSQPDNDNEVRLRLRGSQVGSLDADGSFIPTDGTHESEFLLRRQPNNQWRIADAPQRPMITKQELQRNYHRMPLYFYAPDSEAPVPDLRFVPGKPREGLARRVVEMALDGPSDALEGAVDNPLEDVSLETNVTVTQDGEAIEVPLSDVERGDDARNRRIVAQLVRSLETVSPYRVSVRSDGEPLVAGSDNQRVADLSNHIPLVTPRADLPGMAVVDDHLVSMGDGQPIDGPAGRGSYRVESAAQSLDGSRLAVIERGDDGMWLRVGGLSDPAESVDLDADSLTRPTWRPSLTVEGVANEVWTVRDGDTVVRVVQTPQEAWQPQEVDTRDLRLEDDITSLRLSPDGTRAAVVVDGKLVLSSVARSSDSVRLRAPRPLRHDELSHITDVDWFSQDRLVVSRSTGARPVLKVTVDGFEVDRFERANLEPPVRAVTATPDSVVTANDRGLWTASDVGEPWEHHDQVRDPQAVPFFPG